MALKIALQMDPIERVDIEADSSFRLALEAQARGHELFYYTPGGLHWREGRVMATGWPLRVQRAQADHFTLGEAQTIDLSAWDAVLLRQDPPFDMAYLTTTYILEKIHPRTLVVNNPTEVRNAPEKLLVLDYPDLTPPTLITRDLAEIRSFRARYRDIILKPLYGNGGERVFKLSADDVNLNALHEMFSDMSREPFIAQQFLPAVARGDKRVILIDGEAVGAINRIPAKGEARSNMHVGGEPASIEMDARDREICARIGPMLRERGLIFVGIDVIDGYLTEINVTSPTGIQELERFDRVNAAEAIMLAIERRRAG